MTIIIPFDKFLFHLFSFEENDKKQLIEKLKAFYKFGASSPIITDKGDYLKIELDLDKIEVEEKRYNELLNLCENNKFNKALSLAQDLVSEYPTVSEYHRL